MPWTFKALQQFISKRLSAVHDLLQDVEVDRLVSAGGVDLTTVLQARARNLQHFTREILDGRAAKARGKRGTRPSSL